MKIVIATRNEHKVKELKKLLSSNDLRLFSLSEIDPNNKISEVEETGLTLLENAYLKAEEIHNKIGLPCIADDSGLEVDCLNGEPGVFSARYAGKNCTVDDNIEKLLFNLKDFSLNERTASFKTVLAYVDKKLKFDVIGQVNGHIAEKKTGDNGFGYDPIFIVNKIKKTYASLSSSEKSKVSHRAEAVKNILVKFREFNIIN
tara:strand:- start:693 stop:1298 length:606 start_codon:yes stop_codon:yes gene_type:complete